MLWEAKATKLERGEIRRQLCAFANSHEGGFLILGARWDGARWWPEGVEFPDEPAAWITNIARDVVPRPRYDTRSWATTGDRRLAVTRIEAVPTPPAIARGVVYERMSGATESVRDANRLAELFRRGDRMRADAQGNADRIAGWVMSEFGHRFSVPNDVVLVALAVARTGTARDISALLFSRGFHSELEQAARRFADPGVEPKPLAWTQHALIVPVESPDGLDRTAVIAATWQGVTAIALALRGVERTSPEHLADAHIGVAWKLAAELQGPLGGFGDSYLTMHIRTGPIRAERSAGPTGHLEIRRGPLPSEYDFAAHFASVRREIMRAAGRASFEGTSSGPSAGSAPTS